MFHDSFFGKIRDRQKDPPKQIPVGITRDRDRDGISLVPTWIGESPCLVDGAGAGVGAGARDDVPPHGYQLNPH